MAARRISIDRQRPFATPGGWEPLEGAREIALGFGHFLLQDF